MKERAEIMGFVFPHPPVVVPSVGKGREREAAATLDALKSAARELAAFAPETIVLLSPHAPVFSDYVFAYDGDPLVGSFAGFGAAEDRYRYDADAEFRSALLDEMHSGGISGGSLGSSEMRRLGIESGLDHGALVPLHFISEEASGFRLVVLASAALDPHTLYRLGGMIRSVAGRLGRRVAIVASGDMSHKVSRESPYGESPSGAVFDRAVADAFRGGDPFATIIGIDAETRERAAECGWRSIVAMAGAFDRLRVESRLHGYEAPFGIGYCVASIRVPPGDGEAPSALDAARSRRESAGGEDLRVRVAERALAACVEFGAVLPDDRLDEICESDEDRALLAELRSSRAGVFVSLKKFGDLRGCIGTTAPTTSSVVAESVQNAVSASTQDPRFDPVRPEELAWLDVSVDVLEKPEPAPSRADLDPSVWGVIVTARGRRGLLLPDLEGVDTVEAQLSIACRKAGIDPREPYSIERFRVTRYR